MRLITCVILIILTGILINNMKLFALALARFQISVPQILSADIMKIIMMVERSRKFNVSQKKNVEDIL